MSTTLAPAHPVPGPPPAPGADSPAGRRGLGRRLVRGRPEDPPWVRPALVALLGHGRALPVGPRCLGMGELVLLGGGAGRAPRAGRRSSSARPTPPTSSPSTSRQPRCGSWSCRPGSSGVNSWSILVPQALEGVATVALLYVDGAALVLGPAPRCSPALVLALTPVAVLMFRYNNPDALLTLLLTAAAYATVRALDGRPDPVAGARRDPRRHRVHHQDAAGVPRGTGRRPRLPGGRPDHLGRRLRQLVASAAWPWWSSAGWWVATVELIPARRPALHRGLPGQQPVQPDLRVQRVRPAHRATRAGSVGGGGAVGSRWGPTGLEPAVPLRDGRPDRLAHPRRPDPAGRRALADAAGRRAPTGPRAAIVLWGGWLVVTGARLQLRPGHHPPLLHGGAGPRRGCAGRRRIGVALAPP